MIQRLNVKATVQNSRLYVGLHIATADTGEGEIGLVSTGHGLVLTFEGANKEVYVSYEDLVKSAMEVV